MTLTRFVTERGAFEDGQKELVDALLARLAAADQPRLVLFVHGGLVSRKNGEAGAEEFARKITDLVAEGWEVAAPIWQSGLSETIRQQWQELEQEPRFLGITSHAEKWAERREAMLSEGAALTALSDAWLINPALLAIMETAATVEEQMLMIDSLPDEVLLEDELAQDILADEELVALLEAGQPLMDAEVVAQCRAAQMLRPAGADKATGLWAAAVIAAKTARAVRRVIARMRGGRGHGIKSTIVEEILRAFYVAQIGASIWGEMKDNARRHFEGDNAGAYLLAGLSEIARGGKEVQLLAIGHSAGSVFCGQLALATKLAPANLKVGHILLAPAIALAEAADTYARGRYEGLRVFTMGDDRERMNALDDKPPFNSFYAGSLLYLISGVLEDGGDYADAPLLGLQRHLEPGYAPTRREREALQQLGGVLAPLPVPVVYAPSPDGAPEGQQTNSRQHGGYWWEEQTVESIKAIAREGFGA